MKTRDALLDRSHRDLEHARSVVSRQEREIENLKAQLTKARMIQDTKSALESPSLIKTAASARISPPIYHGARQSAFPAEKENLNYLSTGTKLPTSRFGFDSAAGRSPAASAERSGHLANGVHDWKNAADLTAKLRERIDLMKKADSHRI